MTPLQAFTKGYSKSKELILQGKVSDVEKNLLKARKKYMISQSFADKKYYDGIKKALNKERPMHSIKEPLFDIDEREVKHCVVSPSLYESFGKDFVEKYNLVDLSNHPDIGRVGYEVPCVYFGCYKDLDIARISRNRSDFKIIVYGGTDATRFSSLKRLRNIKGLNHVAISSYVSKDLDKMRINHKLIPITPVDHSKFDFFPEKKGDTVYIYNCSPSKAAKYGKALYEKVIKRLSKTHPQIKFSICGYKTYDRQGLIDVYKNSFIGLRLIDHDGLPNTVIELGLMGRRVVHNGGLPSGIPYSSVDDVCEAIVSEYNNRDVIEYDLSIETREYLENSTAWLKREYWEDES